LKNETLDQAMVTALKQIEERRYDSELKSFGIKDIIKPGIAFKGKENKINSVLEGKTK